MKDSAEHDAFISYSHKDKIYASIIQRSIETLGLPFYKKWQPDVSIFRDERKIPLSSSLSEEILTGLRNSNHLIIIASKNSANSNWVKEEIINWHSLNKDAEGYITRFNFILIDDVVEWDNKDQVFDKLKTTALPSFEKKIFKHLPLWADIRHYCKFGKIQTNNANYQWEIAKIKAYLLGKKPDEIIDEVSRGRRFFQGVISVIITLLSILTMYAYQQKKIANEKAQLAMLSEAEAKKQRDSAMQSETEAQKQRDSAILAKIEARTNLEVAQREKKIAEIQLAITKLFATRRFPEHLDNLWTLDSLDCRGWGLERIPDEIGKLQNLKYLDLSANNLVKLPSQIGKLKKLLVLDLSINKLKELPKSIGDLKNLRALKIGGNNIDLEKMPIELANLKLLDTLYAGYNEWTSIPIEIYELRNLSYLDLSMNFFDSVSYKIGNLKKLMVLDLSDNQLTYLPNELVGLRNLESLNLSKNKFENIPIAKIPQTTTLKTIDFRDNSFPFKEYIELRRLMPWCHIFIDHDSN